jgi:hypothetical protein
MMQIYQALLKLWKNLVEMIQKLDKKVSVGNF